MRVFAQSCPLPREEVRGLVKIIVGGLSLSFCLACTGDVSRLRKAAQRRVDVPASKSSNDGNRSAMVAGACVRLLLTASLLPSVGAGARDCFQTLL